MARHPPAESTALGFSTVFQQNVASLVLSKILKLRDPSVYIVFGGGNCDGPMGKAMHECFPWVDIVVRGEGERVLVDLVTEIVGGEPIRPKPGLCYRSEGQSVAVSQADGPQVPIDEVLRKLTWVLVRRQIALYFLRTQWELNVL